MKKNVLLWCVALLIVQGLVGCNSINQSQCNSDSPCKSAPGLLQQTWMSMTKKDTAKSTPVDETKNQVARKDGLAPTKSANQDAKTGKLFPLFPLWKMPRGTPDRQIAKNITTKEPPMQDVASANGNESTCDKDLLISIALPDMKNLPAPLHPAMAITIRSDESPAKVETCEPGKGKAHTITLKSVHIKYGAAENYTILVGRVQEWRKTLRLRYAAVEQEDTHGGSVMLEGEVDLQQLRDGQHVRVRGALIPAEDRVSSARFRVEALEILD